MKHLIVGKSFSRSVFALLTIVLVAAMAFGQNINNTGGTITNNGTGTIKLTGTFTSIPASIGGTVEFNNAGTQTIPLATYVDLKATGGTGDKTLTTGVTVSGVLTVDNAANKLLLGGGTLNLTGAAPITVTTGSVDFTSGTVNYNADADQTVYGTTYQNLGTSSTAAHAKNAGGAVTVTGTLTNAAPTTLNFGSNTFIGTGATFANSGTLQSAGTVTVTSTASIGGTFTYNSALAQTIAPATYNNLDIAAAGGKTFTSGATYNVGGAYSVVGGGRTYTGSTFNYTGTSGQTVIGESYAALGLSGSGGKTVSAGTASASGAFSQAGGDVTLNGGNLTLSSTGSFATNVVVTSGTLTLSGNTSITGNLTNNGTVTVSGTPVVTFDGAGQTIGGSNAISFYDLTFAGTAAKISDVDLTVTHTFTPTYGVDMTSKTLAVTGTVGTYGSLQEVKGNMTVSTPAAATYTLNNASTTVTLAAVNATAAFTLNNKPATNPAGYAAGHTVNRSYTLSYSNWLTGTVDLKLAYLQAEAGGGVTESKLKDFQGGTIASTSKVHGTPTRVASGPAAFGTLTYAGLTTAQLGGSTNAIAMDDQFNQFISIAAAGWANASTWDANAVPSSSDDVEIAANYAVTISGTTAAAAKTVQIDNGASGGLTLNGTSSLTVSGNLTNNNSTGAGLTVGNGTQVTVSGGTLTNAGAITNDGTITVN